MSGIEMWSWWESGTRHSVVMPWWVLVTTVMAVVLVGIWRGLK